MSIFRQNQRNPKNKGHVLPAFFLGGKLKFLCALLCYLCDPRGSIFYARCATRAQRRQLFEKFYVNYCELCGSKKDTKHNVFKKFLCALCVTFVPFVVLFKTDSRNSAQTRNTGQILGAILLFILCFP